MDHNEELPSSLEEFADRLRHGEILTVEDRADGLIYQLYLDAHQHPIIKQGEQEHHFRHLEAAVVGLLSLVGEFAAKEREAVSREEARRAKTRLPQSAARSVFCTEKARTAVMREIDRTHDC